MKPPYSKDGHFKKIPDSKDHIEWKHPRVERYEAMSREKQLDRQPVALSRIKRLADMDMSDQKRFNKEVAALSRMKRLDKDDRSLSRMKRFDSEDESLPGLSKDDRALSRAKRKPNYLPENHKHVDKKGFDSLRKKRLGDGKPVLSRVKRFNKKSTPLSRMKRLDVENPTISRDPTWRSDRKEEHNLRLKSRKLNRRHRRHYKGPSRLARPLNI